MKPHVSFIHRNIVIFIILGTHSPISFANITPSSITYETNILRQSGNHCVFHTLWNLQNVYNETNPSTLKNPSNNQASYSQFLKNLNTNRTEWGVTLYEAPQIGGQMTLYYYIVANGLENNTYVGSDKLEIKEQTYNSQIKFLRTKFNKPSPNEVVLSKITENYDKGNWCFWCVETNPASTNIGHSILIATKKKNDTSVEIKVFDSLHSSYDTFIKEKFSPFMESFITQYRKPTPEKPSSPNFTFTKNQLADIEQFITACATKNIVNAEGKDDIGARTFVEGLMSLFSNTKDTFGSLSEQVQNKLYTFFESFLKGTLSPFGKFLDPIHKNAIFEIIEKFTSTVVEKSSKGTEQFKSLQKKLFLAKIENLIDGISNSHRVSDAFTANDTTALKLLNETLIPKLDQHLSQKNLYDFSHQEVESFKNKLNSFFSTHTEFFTPHDPKTPDATWLTKKQLNDIKSSFDELAITIFKNWEDILDIAHKERLSTFFNIKKDSELPEKLASLKTSMTQLKEKLTTFSARLEALKITLETVK